MSMTAGLDCGPVFVSQAVPIRADEDAGELHDRLAAAGGELLIEKTCRGFWAGTYRRRAG